MRRERGLSLIIAYKLGKGGLWLVFAATLAVMTRLGLGASLVDVAAHLRHHAGAWSVELADLVTRAASVHALWAVVLALVGDGALSLVEGWSLLHGRWWGPWLVVIASGSLLPFEVVALARHRHLVRLAVLVINAAIVVYLALQALRAHAARRGAEGR